MRSVLGPASRQGEMEEAGAARGGESHPPVLDPALPRRRTREGLDRIVTDKTGLTWIGMHSRTGSDKTGSSTTRLTSTEMSQTDFPSNPQSRKVEFPQARSNRAGINSLQ
jgi:hypothetical protein